MTNQFDGNLSPVALEVLGSLKGYLGSEALRRRAVCPRAADMEQRLLTPAQAKGMRAIQLLCEHMHKAAGQVNSVRKTHDLEDLPCLVLPQVWDVMMQIDEAVMASRCAARRLGISVVQTDVGLTQPPLPKPFGGA